MTAKIRINITVERETLRRADREARRRKMSRSALIRETLREAAANHRREEEEQATRATRRKAIEGIRAIARQMGDWPAEQILHDSRYRLVKDGR